MSWFLDSSTLIDCLRGKKPYIEQSLVQNDPSDIKIPAIVKAELVLGAYKSNDVEWNRSQVELILSPFEVVPFDDLCVLPYASIRAQLEKEGQIIGFNDIVIAATVIAHDGVLFTMNEKEFKRVKGLKIGEWYHYDAESTGEATFSQ